MTDPRGHAGPDDVLDERLLLALGQAAAALTGFSPEAILPDALRRSARELLAIWPPEELLSRVHLRDPKVVHALHQAVSVGETFFFRQPEHFRYIAEVLAPSWISRGVKRVRAWSAGCATGEEAFSIAACLQQALVEPAQIAVDVLGTDLLMRNLSVARAATYGTWSQRPSAPLLAPLLRQLEGPPGSAPLVRILDPVRASVRFGEHNLLEPNREPEPFDLIFCRNVLVYFAPEAARRALGHLSAALAPGGVLMLGSMDLNVAPPELTREGQPESLIFSKRLGADAPRAPTRAQAASTSLRAAPSLAPLATAPGSTASGAAASTSPGSSAPGSAKRPPHSPLTVTSPEPISLHLRALLQLESEQLEAAEQTLRTLLGSSPDYLPGLLERALLHARRGEPAAATALMREVYRRAAALRPDAAVEGPEPLEARFYAESAEAFLRGGRG